MCEMMGWEPDESQLPVDPSDLSDNSQYALLILNALPDKIEGMSGSWLGKDYSGLSAIMDIYDIDDKRGVFELLQVAEVELGKHYSQKQKEQESLTAARKNR